MKHIVGWLKSTISQSLLIKLNLNGIHLLSIVYWLVWSNRHYFVQKYHSVSSSMASLMVLAHFSKFRSILKLCHRNLVIPRFDIFSIFLPHFPSISLSLVKILQHACYQFLILILIVVSVWNSWITHPLEIWYFYLLICWWIYLKCCQVFLIALMY